MKRFLIIVIITITLFCCLALIACNKKEEASVESVKFTVTVIFENPVGTIKNNYEVKDGDVLAPFLNDKQKAYSYYTSRNGTIEWNIYKDIITGDMTLYIRD